MKRLKTLFLLALAFGLLAGCTSTKSSARVAHRFHEGQSANVVLQFSSWDYTFLLRPRYDDNGFLLQVPREKIGQVLDRLNLRQRKLAVVTIGWNYAPDQLNKLVAEWKTILGGCGFHRVVILKSSGGKELNGSLVIEDSNLSGDNSPSLTQL